MALKTFQHIACLALVSVNVVHGVQEATSDVVIIGAGLSGIAAAHRLEKRTAEQGDNLSYFVLEKTNRIGGRIYSIKNFGENGPNGGGWTVERGAGNIVGTEGKKSENPLYTLVKKYNVEHFSSDFSSWECYDFSGGNPELVSDQLAAKYYRIERRKFACQNRIAADFQEEFGYDNAKSDPGVVAALAANCSFPLTTGLREKLKWNFVDFEFGTTDTSLNSIGELEIWGGFSNTVTITDQRGYEVIPQMYASELKNPENVILDRRVTRTRYKVVNRKFPDYPVLVQAEDSMGNKYRYYTKKIITTVSIGVLVNEPNMFIPRLKGPYNPYEMVVYERIYFQFPKKFWGDREFVPHIWPKGTNGVCNNWQSFDVPNRSDGLKVVEGSNILLCDIAEDDLYQIAPDGELTDADLIHLLQPLREIYGSKFVEPNDMVTSRWANDESAYGSFVNWKLGFDYETFYYFIRARRNRNGDKVLFHGGTASCLSSWGFTTGAFLGGERAADLVLQNMFGRKRYRKPFSLCDV